MGGRGFTQRRKGDVDGWKRVHAKTQRRRGWMEEGSRKDAKETLMDGRGFTQRRKGEVDWVEEGSRKDAKETLMGGRGFTQRRKGDVDGWKRVHAKTQRRSGWVEEFRVEG